MIKKNRLKCRYCDYTVARFKGRGKPQGRQLALHCLEHHEEEMKKTLGVAEEVPILDYLDTLEELENRSFGDF